MVSLGCIFIVFKVFFSINHPKILFVSRLCVHAFFTMERESQRQDKREGGVVFLVFTNLHDVNKGPGHTHHRQLATQDSKHQTRVRSELST